MKRIVVIAAALLLGIFGAMADIACPAPFSVLQPDGSSLTITLHGDEYYHWATDNAGRRVKQDADGWWRPVPMVVDERVEIGEARRLRALDRPAPTLTVGRRYNWGGNGLGLGNKRFLVILVEFSDLKFQAGAAAYFRRAMNEPGFPDNGSVGSARDYWEENSSGLFTPEFDVYGPVTLTRAHNDFPASDVAHHSGLAKAMIVEALALLDAEVDFSVYDNNGDKYIDNVYMFFPGYAQSTGGGEDTIWPHSSNVSSSKSFDGVRASRYACSAELQGKSGATFNGIGTFCHEFGHVLGLPDLYDVDYSENGSAIHPSVYNLMASGSHNSNGRIPPYLSTMERNILGYNTLSEIKPGRQTILPVQDNGSYMLPGYNSGEFFLLEVRTAAKWDSGIVDTPSGLLIYHTDQSANLVSDKSAAYLWVYSNDINSYAAHPCHYILRPVESARGYDTSKYPQMWVYPAFKSYYYVDTQLLAEWSGNIPYRLDNISYQDGKAYVDVVPGGRTVSGAVTDSATGKAIPGAVVSICARDGTQPAGGQQTEYASVTTDAQGRYSCTLGPALPTALTLGFYADAYSSLSRDVSVSDDLTVDAALSPVDYSSRDFTLNDLGFNYIQAPESKPAAGDVFPLVLVSGHTHRPTAVKWYYDGVEVDGGSVTLSSGEHRVRAVLVYGGYSDFVELRLKVD